MRHATCSRCAASGPLQSYFHYDTQVYCRACAEQLPLDNAAPTPDKRLGALIDPTICSRCNADNGNSEFSRVGELPFCQPCQDYLYRNPYPAWLKAGLAALMILLIVALVHGRRYFSAGRQLYIGEKLVDQGKYAEAEPHLKQTVQIAPGSDKAVLLLAKAALLSGDPNTASDAVRGHNEGRDFEQDGDLQEVQKLFARTGPAIKKANQAIELAKQPGKAAEAATLMRQAAEEYPEMTVLRASLSDFEAGVAFESKDYDRFLELEELQFRSLPESSMTAAGVASGFACKFAVTGDPSWKQKTEGMLEKAHQLSHKSPEEEKAFDEYAERIRYRLTSRQIIDKPEYDRRFRSGSGNGQH